MHFCVFSHCLLFLFFSISVKVCIYKPYPSYWDLNLWHCKTCLLYTILLIRIFLFVNVIVWNIKKTVISLCPEAGFVCLFLKGRIIFIYIWTFGDQLNSRLLWRDIMQSHKRKIKVRLFYMYVNFERNLFLNDSYLSKLTA